MSDYTGVRVAKKNRYQNKHTYSWLPRVSVPSLVNVSLLLLFVALLWVGVQWWQGPHPIRTVQVYGGAGRLPQAAVVAALRPLTASGFFALSLADVQRVFLAQPWVRTVRVRRIWPDRLQIVVQVHTPVARWGEAQLVSSQGQVFTPPTLPQNVLQLPKLCAPKAKQIALFASFNALASILPSAQQPIRSLVWDAAGTATLISQQGIQFRWQVEQGLQPLQQFFAWHARLKPPHKQGYIKSVDLRYVKGFTVTWAG